MKIVAVIPAYNEENAIADVVRKALPHVNQVVVIDDGSYDGTSWAAGQSGAEVYKFLLGRGVGVATAVGLKFAKFADVVVTLDGDGQHDPNDIPRLVFEIAQGHADVVVGSRYCLNRRRLRDDSETVPMHRSLGIRLITWLYNVGMGSKISDSQCCFRAFRGEVLRNLEIVESGFGFSTEMLMKIRKAGYRIAEVPVRCTYHKDYGKNSTLPPVRHFLEVLWRTLYWRLRFVIEEIKDA